MKLLTILFAAIGIFFLTSCSDVNQDMSPVSPGVDKAVLDPGPITPFIYDYLQEFGEFPVVAYNSGKSSDNVTIELGGDAAVSDIIHAFAVFEYESQLLPGTTKLVFLGKPTSSTIQVPGVASPTLSDVTVYYLGSHSGTPISGAYAEFQNFTEMKVSGTDIQEDHIKVSSPDWSSTLSEAFAEITSKDGSKMVFLEKPGSQQITIPVADGSHVTSVRLFGLFE